MGRPRTKSAMMMWQTQQRMVAAGYPIARRPARCVTRQRLWMRYTIALDLLAQALHVSIDQAAVAVELRLARFDRGHKRQPAKFIQYPLKGHLDSGLVAICPVCSSRLDLQNGTWTPNAETKDLEPLDDLNPGPLPDSQEDSQGS